LKIVQKYNPEFRKELDVPDILSILDEETALLVFCINDKGSIGSVISESRGIQSVDIPGFKTYNLNSLLSQQDGQGSINKIWLGDFQSYLNALGTTRYEGTFQA
jgi:hypothetical protein